MIDPEDDYCPSRLKTEYEDCLVGNATWRVIPSGGTIDCAGDPKDWPLHERPLVYVAGYYSANPAHGTANAVKAFDRLLDAGWLPFVPHASIVVDMLSPRTPEFWYEVDLGYLLRCDAMYVCPDALTRESTGVQREIEFCKTHDIPVLYWVIEAKDRYND